MAQIEFHNKGNIITIHCKEDQEMEEIFNIFISKSNIKENEINH